MVHSPAFSGVEGLSWDVFNRQSSHNDFKRNSIANVDTQSRVSTSVPSSIATPHFSLAASSFQARSESQSFVEAGQRNKPSLSQSLRNTQIVSETRSFSHFMGPPSRSQAETWTPDRTNHPPTSFNHLAWNISSSHVQFYSQQMFVPNNVSPQFNAILQHTSYVTNAFEQQYDPPTCFEPPHSLIYLPPNLKSFAPFASNAVKPHMGSWTPSSFLREPPIQSGSTSCANSNSNYPATPLSSVVTMKDLAVNLLTVSRKDLR